MKFCISIEATASFVTAIRNEDNAVVERAYRIVRSYFECITAAEPSTLLVDAISATDFYKDRCREYGRSSSLELLYDRSPREAELCQPSHRDTVAQATQEFQNGRYSPSLTPRRDRTTALVSAIKCTSGETVRGKLV